MRLWGDDDLVTPEEEARERERVERKAADKAAKPPRRVRNTTAKGKRGERKVVAWFDALGVGWRSRRQPRSGSIDGLPHDVVCDLGSGSYEFGIEVKQFGRSRTKTLAKLRGGASALWLFTDGQPDAEVLITASELRRLLHAAYEAGRMADDV